MSLKYVSSDIQEKYSKEFLLEAYLRQKFVTYLSNLQGRCRKSKTEFSISPDDLSFPSHCPILGIELNYFNNKIQNNSPAVDRVNLEFGFVPGNVQIISVQAAKIKNSDIKDIYKVVEYLKNQNTI